MIKLFAKTPKLLQPTKQSKEYVIFEGSNDDFPDYIEIGEPYIIKYTSQVTDTRAFILPPDDEAVYLLSNNKDIESYLNLYPTTSDCIYEILTGLKGYENILMYIEYPANYPAFSLDSPFMTFDVENDIKRMVSPIDVYRSPFDSPKLRLYTLKGINDIAFRLLNEGTEYGKLIVGFLVNKCIIEKVDKVPEDYTARIIEGRSILSW